jgi:uncharacterized RDD family membrane protein YckC
MSDDASDEKPIIDPWPLGQPEPDSLASITPISPDIHESVLLPLAGFWWRFLGFFVDGIIIGLVSQLVTARISHLNVWVGAIAALLVNFLYASLLIGLWNGQTLGMRACRLRCVDASTRHVPTPRQAAMRALVAGLFTIPSEFLGLGIVVQLVDLVMPAFDKMNRTVHDRAAHTVVVREAKPKPDPTVTFER